MQISAEFGVADTLDLPALGYGRLLDRLGCMLLTVASDGRIISVNEAGVRMFGYAGRQEMRRVGLLFRDPETWRRFWQRVAAESFVKDMPVEMLRKDGSRFSAFVSASMRMGDDETAGCDCIVRDVSGHDEWLKALDESERRFLDLRKRILNTLMFLSHDLRGPIVSMAAGLKLLLRGVFGSMDKSVEKRLNDLLVQTVRLSGIAEDCLARASVLDGFDEIRKEALDLRKDIIDPVLEELTEDFRSGRIRVDDRAGTVEAGTVTVHASGRWLRSVYRNLFRNAVQYGGKECALSFGHEDQGHFHLLNVFNSGESIPEALREKLFVKFSRIAGKAGRLSGGTGLGLYLVREIIRKHGGDIWYEAGQGGSNFVFTIPKDPE